MMLDLQALPEGCIANVLSLTTPRDACRLSSISRGFKSAADSDAVWYNFLPPETHEILSQSQSEISANSKKELYLTLSDNPVLIDDGNMSFSLDKWSGKKCYMIAAKSLRIAHGNNPRFWKWVSMANCRFEKVAELEKVCWLEIRGRIETCMLSPGTIYKAYLVYKLSPRTFGLHRPAAVTVGTKAYGFDYECPGLVETIAGAAVKNNVYLAPHGELERGPLRSGIMMTDTKFPNERADGWLEVELGEYHCRGDEDRELEMICCEVGTGKSKAGLLVQGIEVRPKSN